MKNLFLACLLLPLLLPAQEIFEREKRDNIWQFGRRVRLDFSYDTMKVFEVERLIPMNVTNASICNPTGDLLLYTNGVAVANGSHDTIRNGGRINYGEHPDSWVTLGNNIDQGALILPIPWSENKYCIFYEQRTRTPEINAYATRIFSLTYAIVDMEGNENKGEVLEKDILLVQDTLHPGKIVASRHANGRDWWILVGELHTNRYYRFLLDPEGVKSYGRVETESILPIGVGQAKFSANGKKYIHLSIETPFLGQFISISDFDRCSGELSNNVLITHQDSAILFSGMVIAENSRFLYIPSYVYVFQYDLEAEDIEASRVKIVEYDGFYDDMIGNSRFFMGGLAPDGKIYISSPAYTKHLTVIHHPNKKGLASEIEQHGIELPGGTVYTMPNFPYFGLGPLDGSPCDTLGIDNPPPIADFEYEQDGRADYEVNFYNGTQFTPEATMYIVPEDAYTWDFGDWTRSHLVHPQHAYKESGTYRVCLTVKNLSGSDTHCDTIVVEQNDSSISSPLNNTRLFPNPADDFFYFNYQLEEGTTVKAHLYNIQGRLIRERILKTGVVSQGWEVSDLPGGVYVLVVQSGKDVYYRGKVVVY